ncbi:helix-turn-helix transcriptional regulator [Roseateles sp.]|uniref:ArsR/SmtB family transcription factor n=1 Tax=Roseateles sp. TaxID=1971397 RepID=UPI0025EF3FFB|nr:metalloregulator ArsR/SmtB family transcription factor [Roseateles sp.]MBV8035911.1 helix-turn-helix transcriptional regulator [Roseateles sp.]
MVNKKGAQLDLVFAALADATRRRVLEQLDAGAASVSELARPHGMSLPGFMKHLAVLEAAGLIARAKEGRIVRCELDAAPLEAAAAWVSRYERFWGEQLDALGRYLYHQEEVTPCKTTNSTPLPKSASSGTTPTARRRSGARGPSRGR